MSNNQVLGIIGGAGVAATNKFNELLEKKLTRQGAYRDLHHPVVISYQASKVPSRSMYLEGQGESFVPGYIEIGKKLKEAGATLLCMTCNTAHYAIDDIKIDIDLPFINLIEEVVKEAKNKNKLNIGLIVSDGSRKGQIYERYFKELFPEVRIIYPSIDIQKDVTRGIVNIKNKNRFTDKNNLERPNFIFREVCKHLKENNADIIISGCTDIRVDFSPEDFPDLPIIDSLDTLVNVVIDRLSLSFGNIKQDHFYNNLAKKITKATDSRLKSKETGELDARFMMQFEDKKKDLLDLGTGTGLLINKINNCFNSIVAIEKYPEFSKFIESHKRTKILNEDLLDWEFPINFFDIVSSFGVMHYFNRGEAKQIYQKSFDALKENGVFIVKNQLGITEDVIVDGFSDELQADYYAEYRHVDKEVELLMSLGFRNVEIVDIYPAEYNRWDNTHFYALVCEK